jgi:hypothetical protein
MASLPFELRLLHRLTLTLVTQSKDSDRKRAKFSSFTFFEVFDKLLNLIFRHFIRRRKSSRLSSSKEDSLLRQSSRVTEDFIDGQSFLGNSLCHYSCERLV